MKRRFFRKTYLWVLMVFLISLLGLVFSFLHYADTRNDAMNTHAVEQEAEQLAETYNRMWQERGSVSEYRLQRTYMMECLDHGELIGFYRDSDPFCTMIPRSLGIPPENTVNRVYDPDTSITYFIVNRSVGDGTFSLVYAKEITSDKAERIAIVYYFIVISLCVTLGLALLLYGILRKLFFPLDRLQKAANSIAYGDFSARADCSGNDELAVLGRDFNVMTDRLVYQMQELKLASDRKQRMLDDLAHEMRTPLAVIHGYAEYLRGNNITEEEQIESVQCIMQEAMRLQKVSEALLDTAFIRENKIVRTPVPMAEILCGTAKRLSAYAEERSVTLSCDGTDATVAGDKTLLEMLLSNLTENAIRACRGGGEARLSVAVSEHGTTVTVEDNGIGMTEEQLAHITEPFYRTDKARSRRDGGTGLGLSLCRQIVIAHGASMEFTSEVGKGTKIDVKFPNFDADLTTI